MIKLSPPRRSAAAAPSLSHLHALIREVKRKAGVRLSTDVSLKRDADVARAVHSLFTRRQRYACAAHSAVVAWGMYYHYLHVISSGPLVIVRIPWPRGIRWRDVLKALTALMATHGYRRKDISTVEGVTHYAPDDTPSKLFRWNEKAAAEDAALRGRLAAAFDGDPSILPTFWLYDWDGREFVLARPAAQR